MGKMKKWDDILSSQSKALGNKGNRQKNTEKADFDIFPDWLKTSVTNSATKDKRISDEKDGLDEGNYLSPKRSPKNITPTQYNDSTSQAKTPFSSPNTEQSQVEPTNIGGYEDYEDTSISYDDPIISTKDTPTSIKRGVPRPGPSTFIQTAMYNPTTKQLNIQYTDGTIFPYYDVSPELADMILKKKSYHSPGQTLVNTIFKGHGTTRADMIDDIMEGM